MYGHIYENCEGTVRENRLKREAANHKEVSVILEYVSIGMCDKCSSRYYHSSLLQQALDMASTHLKPGEL